MGGVLLELEMDRLPDGGGSSRKLGGDSVGVFGVDREVGFPPSRLELAPSSVALNDWDNGLGFLGWFGCAENARDGLDNGAGAGRDFGLMAETGDC